VKIRNKKIEKDLKNLQFDQKRGLCKVGAKEGVATKEGSG
jgi:hypothetical protein